MNDEAEVVESLDDQVGKAIREAQTADGVNKLPYLRTAEELLLTRDGGEYLIDNFLDEMLQFAATPLPTVKCFIASFIEKACKKDAENMKKAVGTLTYLLMGESPVVAVLKKVMSVCCNVYPVVLRWAVAKRADMDTEKCWEQFSLLKGRIMYHIDSDNEGVRTMVIKFLEAVVLSQSMKSEESEPRSKEGMNLSDIPRDHRFISYRKMANEAQHCMSSLIEQTKLAHISSQNLLTVISAICNIARQRPEFLPRVVDCLESLQVNLPPTLGTSQVKAVRKELKMHLLRMLKHPSAANLATKIGTLLTDLGATPSEIAKAMPEAKKRQNKEEPVRAVKRARMDVPSSSTAGDDEEEEEEEKEPDEKTFEQSAVDITEEFVFERLNPKVVANLVLISLVTLPDEMPAALQSSYTPIATAGSEAQRRRLSRMIATQATQADCGPGAEKMREERRAQFQQRRSARNEGAIIPPTPLHTMNTSSVPERKPKLPPQVTVHLPPPSKQKQQFTLVTHTQQLSPEENQRLFELALKRIMQNERRAVQGGAGQAQQKLLVRLVSRFREDPTDYETLLVDFILADQKGRAELALLWVAEKYAQYQGFSICVVTREPDGRRTTEENLAEYNRVLCLLLRALYEKGQHNETLFYKLFLEAPFITEDAMSFLKYSCLDDTYGAFGMTTLRELVLTRARQRRELLLLLFHLSFYSRPEVRGQSVETVKELYELSYMRGCVREVVEEQLEGCVMDEPPAYFTVDGETVSWCDALYRAALVIPVASIPQDHELIHVLSRVYGRANTEFKRIILKCVEPAIKGMGMSSPEVPLMIERCPKGSETLIARVVNILTERAPATKELVLRLKKLHEERNTDVRSLIPVLTGLTKDDIIRILPEFMLNPSNTRQVGQVIKKILSGKNYETGEPALNAVELLLEYHKMVAKTKEEKKCLFENVEQLLETRAMTKEATSTAVERMMDIRPLPPLLFHTLSLVYRKFPMLDSFLSNVLHKITSRKMWKATEEHRLAFLGAIADMGTVAYAAVLTDFSEEEMREFVADSSTMMRALRNTLPSLSSHQQRAISKDVLEYLQVRELPCESRRDRERDDRESRKERRERRP